MLNIYGYFSKEECKIIKKQYAGDKHTKLYSEIHDGYILAKTNDLINWFWPMKFL